jgi:hypothetical protein
MKLTNTLVSLLSLILMAGCTESLPEEELGAAEDSLTTDNALTQNALTQNALTQNALTQNALTQNALTQNALTQNALNAIKAPTAQGDLNRQFLRYAVACAFKPSQSFDFTWTDSDGVVQQESYAGQLGIAPHWKHGKLGKKGEQMVSACLAAKVNYYGVPVTISVRSGESPLKLHPWDDELVDFPNIEGAFWGNLWDEDGPYINSCYVPANVANSRAQLRDCAAGHVKPNGTIEECGIINIIGACKDVCKDFSYSRQHYGKCREKLNSNKFTKYVITTALP